jgi:hypothetical protein
MSSKSAKKSAEKAPPPTRTKVVRLRSAEAPPAPALGAGAHFAKLFKKLGEGRYEARLFAGERLEVGVAPEVDLELADRCLAEQEIVLVGALGAEVVLFGALRTKERKPEEVVVEAPRRLVLRAGKAKLELSADGKVKLSGNDLTVDAPREVRLASARVEIP